MTKIVIPEKPSTETDLATLASDALIKALDPVQIKKIVDDRMLDTVSQVVRDATRSYSPFAKELEEHVKNALSVHTLNLPSYGTMITDMVERIVQKEVADLVGGRLQEDLRNILSIAPKTIKLSEIAKEMIVDHEEDGSYGEVITVHVEDDRTDRDSSFWGPSWRIYLDERSYCDNPKDAEIEIRVMHGPRDKNGPPSSELNTGTIWNVHSNGRQHANAEGKHGGWAGTYSRPTSVYGLTERILAYYASGTIIEIDEDEIIITVGDY